MSGRSSVDFELLGPETASIDVLDNVGPYGLLRNVGVGPATKIQVHRLPRTIYFGDDVFGLDKKNRRQLKELQLS